jgi:hypothetical protein
LVSKTAYFFLSFTPMVWIYDEAARRANMVSALHFVPQNCTLAAQAPAEIII